MDLESEAMRGPGSIPTEGNIFVRSTVFDANIDIIQGSGGWPCAGLSLLKV